MPARLDTAPHLPRPLLYDQALRHAGKLQNRRTTVVPGPDPAGSSVHPPRPLRPDHDGLPGADHKEHGHPAETAHEVPPRSLRHLPRQVPLGPLRLLDHIQLHHLRPELRDLQRPPTQESRDRRREILYRDREESHACREARERRGSPVPEIRAGPEEERPCQEQEEKEGRKEEIANLRGFVNPLKFALSAFSYQRSAFYLLTS